MIGLLRGLLCLALIAFPAAASAAIRVAPTGHYFESADGKPFFWLADTAWDLAYRTTRPEATAYLAKRASQGFNVVQVVALSENDGVRLATDTGQRPFVDGDPARPNAAFFDHLVWLVDEAGRHGLHVALLPTWGDKLTAPWGTGPRLFSLDNLPVAESYARYLATRMCGRTNVFWMLGGDRPPTLAGAPEWTRSQAAGFPADHDWRPIWRAMARGLGAGCTPTPLIGYHPQGGWESTSVLLPDEPWLAFNGLQSGHGGGRDTPVWRAVARDHALRPAKPVVDLEINYEDHPVNPWPRWDPASGYFRDHDVRKQAYRGVFAGAAGVTYGHHAVWQFASERHPGVNHTDRTWTEALDRPGAGQMRHLLALMMSRPYGSHAPAPDLILDNGDGARRAEAMRGPDGSYAFIYVPAEGQRVTIALDRIRSGPLKAWWFDPRRGHARPAGLVTERTRAFTPPKGGPDWVLVLDDPAAGYGPPGARRR